MESRCESRLTEPPRKGGKRKRRNKRRKEATVKRMLGISKNFRDCSIMIRKAKRQPLGGQWEAWVCCGHSGARGTGSIKHTELNTHKTSLLKAKASLLVRRTPSWAWGWQKWMLKNHSCLYKVPCSSPLPFWLPSFSWIPSCKPANSTVVSSMDL